MRGPAKSEQLGNLARSNARSDVDGPGGMHAGDTQALPGYVSFYLQLQDPTTAPSNRWDCFASYKLSVQNQISNDLDLSRESWHRFSSRPMRQQTRPLSSSSHGWADFASANQVGARPLHPCTFNAVLCKKLLLAGCDSFIFLGRTYPASVPECSLVNILSRIWTMNHEVAPIEGWVAGACDR